jgi:nucleotide-binding universal stress UspA family protein
MALKDLLVHIDNSKANAGRLDAAVRLAAAHQAHLTGLYVKPGLSTMPTFAEAHISEDILLAQREAEKERAEQAQVLFEGAAEKAGVSSEWRVAEGDFASTLSLHGRYVDLVIIGQADESDPFSMMQGAVEHLIVDVGRPILVIPYIGASQTPGERVLVGWNASREAMRAIHDAMPLLERAADVQVLSINPPHGPAGDGGVPGADISLHLARHGVKAEAAHIQGDDIRAGEMLLSRAADHQSDLIVMGAYGHSRYRELILGGATRQMLKSMTVPVLMSH